MTKILAKSFKDMFSGIVLWFVIKVALISLVLTAGILWLIGGGINDFVSGYLSWVPWSWVQTTGASVASIAMSYMIFIMMLSIVTSFLIEPLLIELAQQHYPEQNVVGTPDITTSTLLSLKSAGMMFVIFIFTFPVMFIPLVGAVYMLWLWSLLIKEPTTYDVASLFISSKAELKAKTKKTTILAMIAAGFNYIPVMNIFSAVFAQILFLHKILGEKK